MSLVAIALVVQAAAASAAETWSGPPVLLTSGQAELRVAPDRAIVRLTTEARAQTAKAAQQAEARAMTAVRKALADSRIPDESVRTLSYELQLEYDYVQGKQTPRGYVARHVLEVRVDDLPQLGDVIGKAVDSGAAAVSGIQFDVKARDGLEREALRKAVEDARARADAAAAGAGMAVAGVIRIEEQRQFEGPRPMMLQRGMAADAAVATPIAAGEIEIRSTVALTSALK
jgi:uncharacterized protein YggE